MTNPASIPIRRPFVRSLSFVDDIGPPPFAFFDETQDHLGVASQMTTGQGWSYHREDFDAPAYPAGYVGAFQVTTNVATTLEPVDQGVGPGAGQGASGVWRGRSGVNPFRLVMESAQLRLSGDFLFSARVWNKSRERLDPFGDRAFIVGTGSLSTAPLCPAFAGGDGSENWRLVYAGSELGPPTFYDSGVPFLDETWYTLQISRHRGGVRWYINGRLIRVDGLEGVYFPFELTQARRYFEISRFKAGPADDGFLIDYFHRKCER